MKVNTEDKTQKKIILLNQWDIGNFFFNNLRPRHSPNIFTSTFFFQAIFWSKSKIRLKVVLQNHRGLNLRETLVIGYPSYLTVAETETS